MHTEEREQGQETTVEGLQKALEEERAKAQEYLSSWQRAQADFINYKRRTEQEKSDLTTSANAGLILSILPVIDDMERALSSPPEAPEKLAWTEGIKLIYRKLQSILESRGLKEIEAVGQAFDPRLHEAIAYEDGGREGIVVRETQKGYVIGDRVLRPSLVTVGRGTPAPVQKSNAKRRERRGES